MLPIAQVGIRLATLSQAYVFTSIADLGLHFVKQHF